MRAFLDSAYPAELEEEVYRSGVSHDADFIRRLAEQRVGRPGLGARRRPRAARPVRVHVLEDELTKAEAPTVAISTTEMVASVIRAVGTDG